MAPPLRRRDRWLALLLLLAAGALVYLLLVHPLWTQPMRAVDAEVGALREREQRIQIQLQQAPQVSLRLQQARQALAARPGFLPQGSVELAASALIQRLEQAVESASPANRSCAISNRSPLPADHSGRFVRVAVQVRLRCGTAELARLLYALESGSPRLFVDNLSMLAQRFPLSPGESGNGLDVAFELAGYLPPGIAQATATEGNDAD
ncbi:type II secretion system protein GspM [Stenotrophomonas sp. YIM B06876]|uniref:type II secretion system protein GspM n=1 Tax=Stenotrophomonas sp. YIM B06876 TaxID=3060211 RepID=UPI002739E887|nr:type II secretion system protein GspM [Stenotrophomonas sp. YIM B06876]